MSDPEVGTVSVSSDFLESSWQLLVLSHTVRAGICVQEQANASFVESSKDI